MNNLFIKAYPMYPRTLHARMLHNFRRGRHFRTELKNKFPDLESKFSSQYILRD